MTSSRRRRNSLRSSVSLWSTTSAGIDTAEAVSAKNLFMWDPFSHNAANIRELFSIPPPLFPPASEPSRRHILSSNHIVEIRKIRRAAIKPQIFSNVLKLFDTSSYSYGNMVRSWRCLVITDKCLVKAFWIPMAVNRGIKLPVTDIIVIDSLTYIFISCQDVQLLNCYWVPKRPQRIISMLSV